MNSTRRIVQFVGECVAGVMIAGVVLGAAVPLLSNRGLMPGWPWNGVMIGGTMALLVAVATLRPRGSLRRRG